MKRKAGLELLDLEATETSSKSRKTSAISLSSEEQSEEGENFIDDSEQPQDDYESFIAFRVSLTTQVLHFYKFIHSPLLGYSNSFKALY